MFTVEEKVRNKALNEGYAKASAKGYTSLADFYAEGYVEGYVESIILLKKAVKAAKENNLTTEEQIVAAGFDRDVAKKVVLML